MTIDILKAACEILDKEILALRNSRRALGDGFVKSVRLIHRSKGKVVVTGIGKSGLIAQKIAATMASTGTTAIFMHATDAMHGDLGMVNPEDVVLALSHSGQSVELLELLAPLRRIGAKVVAMVGNASSDLADGADCVIWLDVPDEADHLNLAPTSSALAALAVGDALAGILSQLRGFKHEDFAKYHPGGSIGRRLLLTVRDLMHSGDDHPMVTPKSPIDDVLAELTEKRMGGVNVVDNRRSRKLVGFIAEGDLRRALTKREGFFSLTAADLMTQTPTVARVDHKAEHALELMENRPAPGRREVYVLPVVDDKGRAVGILRMHDLLNMAS